MYVIMSCVNNYFPGQEGGGGAATVSTPWLQPQTNASRGLGWRMHESVEDTKLSTNKQHSLSLVAALGFFTQSTAVTDGCWERMARLPPAAGCAAI